MGIDRDGNRKIGRHVGGEELVRVSVRASTSWRVEVTAQSSTTATDAAIGIGVGTTYGC